MPAGLPGLVTLTADFEQREPFAARLKGILLSRCPEAWVLDLGHDIPRGDVMSAAGREFPPRAYSFSTPLFQ